MENKLYTPKRSKRILKKRRKPLFLLYKLYKFVDGCLYNVTNLKFDLKNETFLPCYVLYMKPLVGEGITLPKKNIHTLWEDAILPYTLTQKYI